MENKILIISINCKPIVKDSNMSLVDPLIGLLKSLHIEVQYEGKFLLTLDTYKLNIFELSFISSNWTDNTLDGLQYQRLDPQIFS